MLESAIVTFHGNLICATKGRPASVEFDFDAVWKFKKKYGQGFNPKYLTWIHVHPSGFGTGASEQDQLCAASLAVAFRELDRFWIIAFDNQHPNNIRGTLEKYKWNKEQGRLISEGRREDIEFSLPDRDGYILKTLSYGDLWSKASQSTDSEPSAQTSSSS